MRIVRDINGGIQTLLESSAAQQTAVVKETTLRHVVAVLCVPSGKRARSRAQMTIRIGNAVDRKARSGHSRSSDLEATTHSLLLPPKTPLLEKQVGIRVCRRGSPRLALGSTRKR
jgi:hypothetical protein